MNLDNLDIEELDAAMDDEQMLTMILDLLDRFAKRRGIKPRDVLENILDLAAIGGVSDLDRAEIIDLLMELS